MQFMALCPTLCGGQRAADDGPPVASEEPLMTPHRDVRPAISW